MTSIERLTRTAPWTNEELLDLIAEAIDDSMDMDWQSHWGARSILAALEREGLAITPIGREIGEQSNPAVPCEKHANVACSECYQ